MFFYSLPISSILKAKALVAQSCPTLCDPMDYSPLSSSVHGIFQARMLEWIAIHSLLQGIFLTQRLKPGLLHCRQILYHPSHQGSPSPQYLQFSSVALSCLTLCDPMNCSTPDLPVHHQLLESTQTHVHRCHLILCRPLLLLPPIPPSIRVYSNESIFCMR